eukprot:TRINITY_DN2397_c0_g2_i4.p2 TRINITY_DN2397_c0_g2~~TRINITY_DN2397_c0_g2_i4.p2  ORF type:complete len:214 (+),score=59.06 TRINITY_DN2397_c0_g2_i4:416-1057(+)
MTHVEMAQDVVRYADSKEIEKFTVLGHSMGGKTAMTLATIHPERIDGIIVIDIPPKHSKNDKEYKSPTVDLISKLEKYKDLKGMTRAEAIDEINEFFSEEKAFAWLVTQNIGHVKGTRPPKAHWTCDMDAIYNNLENIYDMQLYGKYTKDDVLLVLGGRSYKYSRTTFEDVFPGLKARNVRVIPGAGHWVHAEKPEPTKVAVAEFLQWVDSGK